MTAVPSSEDIRCYAEEGCVVLRGVLAGHEIERLRAGIERVLASPGELAIVASPAGDPGRFVEDFCRWTDVPEIGELARSSRLPAIAAALMGSHTVRLYHDHVLVKEAGTSQRTPWHQDQPYYNVEGGQTVSFWLPADPVPLGQGLELVAGTHLGPWLMPRTFLDGQARWFPEGSLAELPDIEADRSAFPIRTWALEPGDAIAFHGLSVHGAPGFRGPGRRRVLSLRYLGDDVRHAPRAWRTSPPFTGLEAELPAGAPMEHPRFPAVR